MFGSNEVLYPNWSIIHEYLHFRYEYWTNDSEDHWRSMKFYYTSYLSVRTADSLKPKIFSLFYSKPLNHFFLAAIKLKNSAFCFSIASILAYFKTLALLSSSNSYFFLISFSSSISFFSSASGNLLKSRGLHWTSCMFFWRVSLVTI